MEYGLESGKFRNKKAILFDLGGTLVRYYKNEEFPSILRQGIFNVSKFLGKKYIVQDDFKEILKRAKKENYENEDYRVRPLEKRLERIFQLKNLLKEKNFNNKEKIVLEMCKCFIEPIFQIERIFEDTKPTLKAIKELGFKIGLISNTPWGSPSILWHEELNKLELSIFFDRIIFCRDVGWRKPAEQVFLRMVEILNLKIKDCVFIGDDPRWDLFGPNKIGMDAVLIARSKGKSIQRKNILNNLNDFLVLLD